MWLGSKFLQENEKISTFGLEVNFNGKNGKISTYGLEVNFNGKNVEN